MMPFCCVDYDFYANVFLGQSIKPGDLPRLTARGAAYVDSMCRGLCAQVPEQDWMQLKFAVCTVAEILQDEERLARRAFSEEKTVTSETVGNYSVSYGNVSASSAETGFLEKKKREALKLYLSAVPALKSLFCVRSYLCMHHTR